MSEDTHQPADEADVNHEFDSESAQVEMSPARLEQVSAARDRALRCAQIADDLRGKETIILDLTKITTEFDYFVITTGTSPRHLLAIADEVDQTMKKSKNPKLGMEGYNSETWILQDYGDVILHVFTEEARKLYDLERLWSDATVVDWQSTTTAKN